ncbi:MAG: Citryl-CoA lyase [Rhodocyclales bacterium]|nr:Citryl-CoA lyase [Rhodocyclales bacterium]
MNDAHEQSGPDLLQQHVGVLKSRMGTFYPGSHVVFRGHDLHVDLKDMRWPELYLFGNTGRRFSPEKLTMINAIWVYTSYPDVRLWNNRVAALAGNSRSTANLGMSAALAVSEATIYGRGIDLRAITFLINTLEKTTAGESLETAVRDELDEHRSIAGYGRPLINGDERNQHILALAKSLGLDHGPHLALAFAVETFLFAGRWRMKINYGGVAAALCADIGLSPQEHYQAMFPAFLAGMQPCFIEAAEKTEGTLYPISCADICYEGVPYRSWHARQGKDSDVSEFPLTRA